MSLALPTAAGLLNPQISRNPTPFDPPNMLRADAVLLRNNNCAPAIPCNANPVSARKFCHRRSITARQGPVGMTVKGIIFWRRPTQMPRINASRVVAYAGCVRRLHSRSRYSSHSLKHASGNKPCASIVSDDAVSLLVFRKWPFDTLVRFRLEHRVECGDRHSWDKTGSICGAATIKPSVVFYAIAGSLNRAATFWVPATFLHDYTIMRVCAKRKRSLCG